ncbi:hypothetical protein [Streptomyces avidinii]|uniref:Uncharacterized protein n=1 Tax=Streptomyces avidinii TaxID=1895 RepID=A0ABS4LDU2_STRAV|nr:hypothetical protein [Streptomyces avidinii]MBP2040257.1 hypothetical protein [Streptomyces avidinii]GGZ27069.1 hypothetical protein GCM10010343_63000 [Streptomyces avidinii]
MVIRGKSRSSGRVETINLLHERLQVPVEFRQSATVSSMPEPADVFLELDQAYKEFLRDGKLASAVQGEKMRSK